MAQNKVQREVRRFGICIRAQLFSEAVRPVQDLTLANVLVSFFAQLPIDCLFLVRFLKEARLKT